MTLLGIILLVLGILLGVAILKTLGIILIVVGVILLLIGLFSSGVAGRKYWY